jgi:hypothetical protein
MAISITRLSGGTTPANGSDPRTFPAIWNAAADDIEAAETAISVIEANDWVTTARIEDGAVTAPKLANTAGAVMVFDDATARTTAIPTPSEGMVTYLKDTNALEKFDGSAFVNAAPQKILQVVNTIKSDRYSVSLSSLSYDTQDVPGLTATITPTSTSSKVLVLVSAHIGADVRARSAFSLRRGTSDIALGDTGIGVRITSGLNIAGVAAAGGGAHVACVLDSPNTTSPTTYAIRVATLQSGSSQTISVNSLPADTNAAAVSTITLMEVAG